MSLHTHKWRRWPDCQAYTPGLQEPTDPDREHMAYHWKSPGQAIRACGYATEDDAIYHCVWCSKCK